MKKYIHSSLFLFGSSSFAWVVIVTLHELGHAIAMWVTGGKVSRIEITPLSWSYTYYGTSPKYPLFTTASGAGIGILLAMIFLVLTWKLSSLYAAPFYFVGAGAFLQNGGYYMSDLLLHTGGDASSLVAHSAALRLPLLILSILVLLPGLFLAIRLLPMIGISSKDSFIVRMLILSLGIVPYFILSFFYAVVFNPDDIMLRLFAVFISLVLVFTLVLFSVLFPKIEQQVLPQQLERKTILYAMSLGILALVVPNFFP